MPEPNPILGLHVTPGSVCWAQVLRTADGAWRVTEWGIDHAPEDAAQSVARAAEIAGRRTFRGRGAFLALPDGSGCLVSGFTSEEDADVEGDSLRRELHEFTPLDPTAATLRHRLARVDGRRREFVVAALPVAQERRFIEAAATHDDGSFGFGFAGAALVRGAIALGLATPPAFLVEVLPRTTHVYALDGALVRRFLLAEGAVDVAARAGRALGRDTDDVLRTIDAGAADAATQSALADAAADLAADVVGAADYHEIQIHLPKDPPADRAPHRFVACGPALGRAPLLRALGAHLGPAFAAAPPPAAAPARIVWTTPPGERIAAVAGAVGAALEAFQDDQAQLALRAVPREVHPPRSAGPAIWAAALVVCAVAAGGAWVAFRPQQRSPLARAATVAPRTEGDARAVARSPADDHPTDALDSNIELRAQPGADGSVRLSWTAGAAAPARVLRRLDPQASEWVDVADADVSAASGACSDAPPGPSGKYRWRFHALDDGRPCSDEVACDLDIAITLDLVRVEADGRATFRLGRTWRGRPVAAEATVAPGDSVETQCDRDGVTVALATGFRLASARVREELQTEQTPIPEFGPDGRVVRAADGSVPRLLRDVGRTSPVHEVEIVGQGAARRRTVSRKMTDG